MKADLSVLFLVAAPRTTCTMLGPLAPCSPSSSTRLCHITPPSRTILPAPSYTTAPCPLQQFTPTPGPRPSTAPPTRHPSITCDPDVTTAPPTPATSYLIPHTFRFKPIPPANYRHMLPPPQSKSTYFHIPVHIDPFIHTPLTKKKARTRSTPSRRTRVPQLSPAPSFHKIFIAILIFS